MMGRNWTEKEEKERDNTMIANKGNKKCSHSVFVKFMVIL